MLPAIFMAIMQGLFILLWGAACTAGIFEGIDQGFDTEDIVALSFFGVLVTVSIFIIGGCFCMIRQRVYWLCITAMVLGIISGLACLLPLPFGIWGLVVLLDSRVSAHFS